MIYSDGVPRQFMRIAVVQFAPQVSWTPMNDRR